MKKFGWHIIHRFDGNPDWKELNELIQFDSGVEEPYCETEEDYNQAVREGWIKYDGKETTIWCDGEYEQPEKFDKYRYDQEYIKKNMKRVLITFNRNNPQDMQLVEWMEKQPGSMTGYMKRLIREDMKKDR